MAIYIEEKKNGGGGGGLFGFGILFVILVILGFSAYYLFIIQPEPSDTVTFKEPRFWSIVKLELNLEDVVMGHFFTEHRSYIPKHTLKPAGNSSPFRIP